jgi:hypothetical protein
MQVEEVYHEGIELAAVGLSHGCASYVSGEVIACKDEGLRARDLWRECGLLIEENIKYGSNQ